MGVHIRHRKVIGQLFFRVSEKLGSGHLTMTYDMYPDSEPAVMLTWSHQLDGGRYQECDELVFLESLPKEDPKPRADQIAKTLIARSKERAQLADSVATNNVGGD